MFLEEILIATGWGILRFFGHKPEKGDTVPSLILGVSVWAVVIAITIVVAS